MLKQHQSIESLNLDASWLTIGIFDGVHLGHQKIITTLTEGAHKDGLPSVALTFDPHPATILAGVSIPKLTTHAEKIELLNALGIDHIITLPFTSGLAGYSAKDFIQILRSHLHFKHLVTGFDFALGKNRQGNNEYLNDAGREFGFVHTAIPALEVEGTIVSSTFIRNAIMNGAISSATSRLGRYYNLAGMVVHGDGRGRTINVPTCNIDFPHEKVLPLPGVYACKVYIDGEEHLSVANFGFRPTFTHSTVEPRLEAHILDFDGDLYGKELDAHLVQRVRPEIKFANVQELIAQINKDILITRGIFA